MLRPLLAGLVAVVAASTASGQATDDLIKQLKDPQARARRLAAEKLGRQKAEPAVPALAALLADGWFDAVHAGPLTRWRALRLLPQMAGGTLSACDGLWTGCCRRIYLESPTPVRVHVDGEFFCQPEDGIRQITIDLLPRRLKVLAARAD